MNQRECILSLPLETIKQQFSEMGLPGFRAGQVFSWLHQKQAASFEEMSNLPKELRKTLQQQYRLELPQVAQRQVSQDGTEKYLMQMSCGGCVETVLMQYGYGNTLCVSSQIGCRMGCAFCASAKGGLVRGLLAGEILGQLYAVMKHSQRKVSRIVMMGIGEPLDNLDNVLGFIRIATSPEGPGISKRGITLSTCGLVPGMDKLAKEKLPVTLSVSLHGALDETRSAIMPVNRVYPIGQLVQACKRYQQETGRRVSFEYAMIDKKNDSLQDAQHLANLAQQARAHVNLIPVNAVEGLGFSPSSQNTVAQFQQRLRQLGVNVTVRRRLGSDISAACGQLRQQVAGREEVF